MQTIVHNNIKYLQYFSLQIDSGIARAFCHAKFGIKKSN